ncbi:MAG: winged helix-turn-helix domain-containing protein, partial [Acidobacteriota bacterium]|nr:winged helix-turn-helix domain-containing protein [Acidobacteriota bacterium]
MKNPIDISIFRGPQFYAFSDCYLDTVERRLFKKNRRLDVTPKALEVLQVLIENAGQVVSKDELLGQIWGESFVEEGNLPVQISKLRSALGANKDEPYIVTESGVGYKFVSRVKMVDDDEWSDIIENELSKREDGKHQYTSIAIMPLLNENGDEEVEYLSEGITESLINSLSRVSELRVIARNTVFQFKDKEIDIKKLGRRLRVATILTGRVRLVRDNLVIGVELSKVSDGTQIWGTKVNEPFDDIFEVQERISEAIGSELRFRISELRTSPANPISDYDSESFRLFLKGRYYLRKGGADNLPRAISCFQGSLSIDPTRQDVYLDLANCQILRLAYDLTTLDLVRADTKKLLRQAQALVGDEAGVLCLKGRIAMNLEWKFSEARKLFEKSLEINPKFSSCLCSYANLLATLREFSEAMSISRRILRLDPLSVRNLRTVARIFYRSEQYEAAIVVLEEALELDPMNYD